MFDIKGVLYNKYGFSDKRITNLNSSNSFTVDDRSEGDSGKDNKVYSNFCSIFLHVESNDLFKLTLAGNVPHDESVAQWVLDNNAASNNGRYRSLQFTFDRDSLEKLLKLACVIDDIVSEGKCYSFPNYKYVCPRTANSLRRLHSVLSDALYNEMK